MGITLKTFGGQKVSMADAVQATAGDAVFAAQILRTRILDRTARGVDVDGRPFAPYSTKRPAYYYPAGRGAGRVRGARRLQKIAGGGTVTAGGGIKFVHYAALKAAFGRGTVDLRGMRAPHMLQAIQLQARGAGRDGAEATIGIYGQEAIRAGAHNRGVAGRLPMRRFFGANQEDVRVMADALRQRLLSRLRKALLAS